MVSGELAPGLQALADRYEFIRELGRGGMATVYLARQLDSGRLVAIKAVDGRHAEDGEALARFGREARMVAALDHPNIVRTFAVERLGEQTVAIVMEHVPGATLRDVLRAEGPLSFERAERILDDVAQGLRYAHARGLIHRDVKPENVFLDEESGRALLSDFGIARPVEDDAHLTMTGTSIGTPTYMSPEQIDGRQLDPRSDIYSLGLLGWEMLAGPRPWEGDSLYEVIYKQKHEELPRLTVLRPGIPEPLLFAIEGALHKDRETRWADVDEFLEQLHEREPEPALAPPPDDALQADALRAGALPTGATSAEARESVSATAAPEDRSDVDWMYILRSRALDDAATPEYHDVDVVPSPRERSWLTTTLPIGRARSWSRLAIPLAAALVLAIALARGRRAPRPSDTTGARDSVTRTASAGELDTTTAAARPPAAPPDTSILIARRSSGTTSGAAGGTAGARPAPSRPAPGTARQPASTAPSRAVAAARTHRDSLRLCASPGLAQQSACLAATLADNDVGLNNVYRTLIREMRKQASIPAGAPDPPSVQRLRESQRSWIAVRDAECRRRGAGREGALWAPVRARCLGELSRRRAAVLADRLTDLRAP